MQGPWSRSSSASKSDDCWRESADTDKELPTYDPLSQLAKKERSRLRFAEKAIHVIPLVVVLCAVILWFFSNHAVYLD
ncbi:hypothetical protein JRO89_XS13G0064800 [Xanthoceras sorbifolium]|uniref:Transmembrane protein n=1 Tax=Xanthoceras sorbifolium TaxID=99658 RepID=A0ABQ8H6Y1_9ROSI|nr:hypothetical protein JRO89_XS13G0064800 [Xanthoceras sorbifolium]